MLRINDLQKHKVLYTWELYDVIINFQCVQNLSRIWLEHFTVNAFNFITKKVSEPG